MEMRRILVIAEKHLAAQRISYLLSGGRFRSIIRNRVRYFTFEKDGDEYIVLGLRGHIVEFDYPARFQNWEKIKPEELIWVDPVLVEKMKDIIQALKGMVNGVTCVIIATDYDREGELIGVEAMEILHGVEPDLKFYRAKFSSLTKQEVLAGWENLHDVDINLANAGRARQIIDLTWGAVLTRMISLISSQRGRDFLSVGRVQTPTLALIVNREREIVSFVPQPFWVIQGRFVYNGKEFTGEHVDGQIWDEKKAKGIYERCKSIKKGLILEFKEEDTLMRPPPPFDTTGFLAELGKIGITAYRGMAIAEELYMKGYISYPRTDNTVYPRTLSLRSVLESLVDSDLGEEATRLKEITDYHPTRGPRETTDHPPIYPTQGLRRSEVSAEHWKVYELIARRFMATIAPPARIKKTNARLDINGEVFGVNGDRIEDPGWIDFYPYIRIEEKIIPELKIGEYVDVRAITLREGKTRPPARYSESKLLREMASLNLGTKSTRHEIIQKLHERKLIEGRSSIRPTPQAMALISSLEKHAEIITTPDMTAHLEKEMDEIAEGKKGIESVVQDSRVLLQKASETIRLNEDAIKTEISRAIREYAVLGRCKCGGEIRIIRYRGRRFAGCSNYPECKVSYPLPPNSTVRSAGSTCKRCGMPNISIQAPGQKIRIECIDYNCHMHEEDLGKCPKCKTGVLKERRGSSGKRFVACSNYPRCKNTYPLPQSGKIQVIKSECGLCGAPIVMTYTRSGPWSFCLNMDCPSKKKDTSEKPADKSKKK